MAKAFINALVYTGTLDLKSAFVVDEDKFIYVGDNETAKSLADEICDLNGKFVCPGFNDSHMHLLSYGNLLMGVDLHEHTSSIEDILMAISSGLKDVSGAWLVARGWNQDYFVGDKIMPSRSDLDSVSKDVAIIATRCCGHCLVANSRAIELANIDESTVCPDGGSIDLQKGHFFDNAMDLIYNSIPDPNIDTIKQMILKSCRKLNEYGVTSAQSDDYCLYRNIDYSFINEAYRQLIKENKLSVRVCQQANFTNLSDLKRFIAEGNNTGVGDNMYKIGPLKMLGDGSLGARTAYLSKPYEDDKDNRGFPIFSQEEFDEMVSYANENNMDVAIHSIGDASLDMILDAIEKALKKHPRNDHRHGIVHLQISRPDQLKRVNDLNLHVFAQTIFLDYDINIVEKRVGMLRASSSYSWKTLMNLGTVVSNGTDCPVELPDALRGMECAVTRCTINGHVGPYLKDEAFSVKEALDSYTINSAINSRDENIKGFIKEGYLADFVVLDKNIFEVDRFDIHNIKVLKTYLNGEQVYSNEME